jgi:hypothetical protein
VWKRAVSALQALDLRFVCTSFIQYLHRPFLLSALLLSELLWKFFLTSHLKLILILTDFGNEEIQMLKFLYDNPFLCSLF